MTVETIEPKSQVGIAWDSTGGWVMKDGVRTPLTTRPSVALEIETITGRWEFLSFSAGLGATATMREGVLVWVPLTDGDKATLETFIADWCVT